MKISMLTAILSENLNNVLIIVIFRKYILTSVVVVLTAQILKFTAIGRHELVIKNIRTCRRRFDFAGPRKYLVNLFFRFHDYSKHNN